MRKQIKNIPAGTPLPQATVDGATKAAILNRMPPLHFWQMVAASMPPGRKTSL